MSRRAIALLRAGALAGALAFALPAAAQTPAPADSFARFLDGLADSSDATFGTASVDFDTTGLDTLAANALFRPYAPPRMRGGGALFPVFGYHRAQGAIVGGGLRAGRQSSGVLGLRASYATSAKLGRYALEYRRTLWAPGGPLPREQALREGRIGERKRIDVELRYARENQAFMPEHAGTGQLGLGALVSGKTALSIYESRGLTAGLALWAGDWRVRAGVRDARERALPVVTHFSLLGEADEVPENTAATPDEFTEAWGDVAFRRRDWELAGVVAVRGTGDRRRLRGALGKALRLGPHFKLMTQVEGGAAAAAAPRQRRFELGGAHAIPTLPYGQGGTDHLLFGRAEILGAQDVLAALHLPHPDWLVLSPSVFFDYGNVWDDPAGGDAVFSTPPGAGWRGAAGGGLSWRIGLPEPDVTVRLWMAYPVGPNAGASRFSASLGRTFDLLGRL